MIASAKEIEALNISLFNICINFTNVYLCNYCTKIFVIVVNTCVCRRSADNKALILSYPILLPSTSPPQPSLLLSFQLSRQTCVEMLAMQAKFLLNLWLCNLLLDKAGVPLAQAAVGASACATDQDVNKLTAKLGSGLSTGGR